MKVILNQDVRGLGEEGDFVTVKDGYARNFLLPKKLAVPDNKANQLVFKARSAAIKARKEEKRKASVALKEKLSSLNLTMDLPVSEAGKLFGSVTSQMVQATLAKNGIDIERKKIDVPSQLIKVPGTYSIKVSLYEGDTAEMKVIIHGVSQVKPQVNEKRKPRRVREEAAEASSEEAVSQEADETKSEN